LKNGFLLPGELAVVANQINAHESTTKQHML